MRHHLSAAAVAAVVAAGIILFLPHPATPPLHSSATVQTAESAYDRVMRTDTLRCGYMTWPNWVDRDPNTGVMSGAWVNIVSAAAKTLGLQVEWTAEISMGDFAAALDTGKIDAYCLATAPTSTRLAQAYFTTPALYAAFDAYVRRDDNRFDQTLDAMNDPAIRISANEGDETGIVVKRRFPLARLAEVSAAEGGSGMLLNVVTGKADVAITDPMTAKTFNAHNDNALKRIGGPRPLTVFGGSIVLPMGETHLLVMFNGAIRDLLNLGVVDQILQEHGFVAGIDYLPVARPYQSGTE